ncbi:MAG: carotenoid 1,2-hydratase [Vicinamibacteria bacterium]|nr:carotenoid 1,2-hydratase [Vicinamibacteria bacterium]
MKRTLVAAAMLALTLAAVRPRPAAPVDDSARLDLGGPDDVSGFARATEPRPLRLPEDHGPHFEYQTEWWYYTGNLAAGDGRAFAYQFTVFRRGLSPGDPPAEPGLRTNQVYFAHLALTDEQGQRHVFAERWGRGAADLAGAAAEPYRVHVDHWQAHGNAGGGVRIDARHEGFGLALELEPRKPPVLHGDRGLSPKSDEPGNASYYVSLTRLATRGRVVLGGHEFEVTGESWFDHEWSTSALGPEAEGWDWFSLQLDDGRELMFFRIRRRDGGFEPASGGTLVERDGTTRRLGADELRIEVGDHWTSPRTGARYPAAWELHLQSPALRLRLEPIVADQEMRTSIVYWEGAVRVSGTAGESPVQGRGFVELSGYHAPMQGLF